MQARTETYITKLSTTLSALYQVVDSETESAENHKNNTFNYIFRFSGLYEMLPQRFLCQKAFLQFRLRVGSNFAATVEHAVEHQRYAPTEHKAIPAIHRRMPKL